MVFLLGILNFVGLLFLGCSSEFVTCYPLLPFEIGLDFALLIITIGLLFQKSKFGFYLALVLPVFWFIERIVKIIYLLSHPADSLIMPIIYVVLIVCAWKSKPVFETAKT